MKHCPICDERYDEEIIRFCTKDGAPLVDDAQPNFTELPSNPPDAPDDDFGEHTVIRSKPGNGPDTTPFDAPEQPERIVIPTSFPAEQQVRPRAKAAYYPPPPPPQTNTGKIVAMTIIGTLAVLSFGAALFWLLQKEPQANININTNPPNQNVNLNTNMGFDSNFNFDTNSNFNTDFNGVYSNLNLATRTPAPTPTPRITPQPSPSPEPTEAATPRPSPSPKPPANTRPSPAPTQRIGPRPPPPPPPAVNRSGDDE